MTPFDPVRFLFIISLPYATFGIYFGDDGICHEAAPVGKWMKGKGIDQIREWVAKKGGTMEEIT